tara:strand:- start:4082 stop:4273 length:192 start_codon:yes stop_codon:yes gene_type:complete
MSQDLNNVVLEERKIKALEKIAESLDSLCVFIEDIDTVEWGDRIEFYLGEFHKIASSKVNEKT